MSLSGRNKWRRYVDCRVVSIRDRYLTAIRHEYIQTPVSGVLAGNKGYHFYLSTNWYMKWVGV